ncbi:MAG: hypothetical protein QM500_21300 [Methylococcales bacterium]
MEPNHSHEFGFSELGISEQNEPHLYIYVSTLESDHKLYEFHGEIEIFELAATLNNLMNRYPPEYEILSLPLYCGQYIDENGHPPNGSALQVL